MAPKLAFQNHVAQFKNGWSNAFYKNTVLYIAVLVTLMFFLMVYHYAIVLPHTLAQCHAFVIHIPSYLTPKGVLHDYPSKTN